MLLNEVEVRLKHSACLGLKRNRRNMEEKQELVKSQVRLWIINDADNWVFIMCTFILDITSSNITVNCEIGVIVTILHIRSHTENQQFLDLQKSHMPMLFNTPAFTASVIPPKSFLIAFFTSVASRWLSYGWQIPSQDVWKIGWWKDCGGWNRGLRKAAVRVSFLKTKRLKGSQFS